MTKRRSRTSPSQSTQVQADNSGILPMFLISIAMIAGYHFFLAPSGVAVANASQQGPANNIVVIDTKTVLQGFMEKMQDEISGGATYTEGEIQASGADFAAEYMRAIKKYRDDGYLVIDKQYALGVPVGSEITEEIGKALSLDVKATPDPFQAPQLD